MLKMDLMVGEKRDDGVKEDLERVVERERGQMIVATPEQDLS